MKTKGFTLIEVILTIVILAVAIPGLISAVSFMTQSQVNTIGTTIAADLAQDKMEEIMGDRMNPARGFAWIVNGAHYPNDTPMTGYNRTVNIICGTSLDLNTNVPPCTSANATDYKRIQVTVSASGIGPSVPDAVLYSVVTNH
ncbi:MAG: prepilin-type N-terminal cleavage/methylation domain-containing protein [Nitrospirae bacterium]|nr:prepilin-type N-terminal cleavage/methylation domain-containing protein [Nitrospirota bacterium]